MICKHGGLTLVWHNELFDITAEMLSNEMLPTNHLFNLLVVRLLTVKVMSEQISILVALRVAAKCLLCNKGFSLKCHSSAQNYCNVSIPPVYRCRRRGSMVIMFVCRQYGFGIHHQMYSTNNKRHHNLESI